MITGEVHAPRIVALPDPDHAVPDCHHMVVAAVHSARCLGGDEARYVAGLATFGGPARFDLLRK
ncbi:hypothetical protein GCM10027447_30280 [Glycomyces halotolerans]